jgi:hypothetical protein
VIFEEGGVRVVDCDAAKHAIVFAAAPSASSRLLAESDPTPQRKRNTGWCRQRRWEGARRADEAQNSRYIAGRFRMLLKMP